MDQLKQSFSWWCFSNRGVANNELLVAAAEIGYQAVEMIDKPKFSMAQNAGLSIATIAGHESIECGLNRSENGARIYKELRESIELAFDCKIPYLICFSGNREGLDDNTGLKNCVAIIERVLPYAEEAGVTLIMELLNSKVNHRDYQCDRTAWAVRLCRNLDSPAFKLLYDIYHMQVMEGDVIRTIQENYAYFAHYHTAGNPGRGLMDDSQELYYPSIYRAIVGTGYKGYVGHEFIPKGNPVEALRFAYNQCHDSFSV